MDVRNCTGRLQYDSSSGTALPPMPLDEWTNLPYDIAMRFWRMRIVEVRHPGEMRNLLFKEPDGTYVFWMSPFSLADGYATAAENMVLALKRNGLKIYIASCWFASLYGLQMETVNMLQQAHPGPFQVGICMATAGEFKKLPTPFKIGLTMYESDQPLENLPEWRHDCEVLDMMLVPSQYCKEIFSSFVAAPIKVVPLAVSPFYYLAKRKRVMNRPFTFGLHGTLTSRKSPLELIDAFKKAFPSGKDVRLMIKTRLGICGYGQSFLPDPGDSRIKIISQDWLPQRIRGWLADQIDVYVFPSKGEGFGMPPREAIATGCPTMLTNCTGMVEIADERYNWPIPIVRKEASPLGGDWAIPDWDYVIETMRWMYQHREETYEKGYQGAKWFIENYGADAAARQLIGIIEAVDPESTAKQEIEPAETIENGAAQEHQEFYRTLQEAVPNGTIVDMGVGEGVLYTELVKRGYKVIGIVEPERLDLVAARLQAHRLPVNLVPSILWEAHRLGIQAEACVSQGILSDYGWHETELILAAMRSIAPVVLFSVPLVNYPKPFSTRTKLHRRDYWEDVLRDFEREIRYYGNDHRYLLVRVINVDPGRRATTVEQDAIKGRVMDGTWRPGVYADGTRKQQ